MRDSTEIRNRIVNILDSKGVIADVDIEQIAEDILFEFVEYTNFINSNYKPFAGDWIKKKDDTIVFHPLVIIEDYAESKMS